MKTPPWKSEPERGRANTAPPQPVWISQPSRAGGARQSVQRLGLRVVPGWCSLPAAGPRRAPPFRCGVRVSGAAVPDSGAGCCSRQQVVCTCHAPCARRRPQPQVPRPSRALVSASAARVAPGARRLDTHPTHPKKTAAVRCAAARAAVRPEGRRPGALEGPPPRVSFQCTGQPAASRGTPSACRVAPAPFETPAVARPSVRSIRLSRPLLAAPRRAARALQDAGSLVQSAARGAPTSRGEGPPDNRTEPPPLTRRATPGGEEDTRGGWAALVSGTGGAA